MKLTTIAVENVLGCTSAQTAVPESGVVLVAGPNASGKSSIAEAIRLALLGGSERAPAKKEWAALVSDGAKAGRVMLGLADGGAIKLALPAGSVTGAPPISSVAAYCLGKSRLSDLKPAERVALLRAAVDGPDGCAAEVARRLRERGHADAYVERVLPLVRSGVEAAAAEAAGMARESKGAWRQITGGETWGAKKSEGWSPAGTPSLRAEADFDFELKKAKAAEASAKAELADANRALARVSSLDPSEIDRLRVLARGFAEAEDRRVKAQTLADGSARRERELVAAVDAAGAGGEVQACPHCDGALVVRDGLVHAHRDEAGPDLSALESRLYEARREMKQADAALREAKAGVDAADAAARRLQAADTAAAADVGALRQRVADAERVFAGAGEHVAVVIQSAAWHRSRRAATDAHDIIVAWSRLAEDLGPSGIVADLAAGPVGDFRVALDEACEACGFDLVELTDDGELQMAVAGGEWRRWWWCSESERWRIDAACALALAKLTGYGAVILDRLDVLAPALRPAVLMGCAGLGLGTVVLCATLASRPKLPPHLALIWMGERAPEAVAA